MGNEPLQLALDPDTRVLSATYAPADASAPPPSWDDLAAAAQAGGWSAEALDSAQVAAFCAQYRDTSGTVTAPVGAVYDGSFAIEIEADRMSALLTLVAPRGGRAIAADDIHAGLAAQGVVAGIDAAAVRQALAQGRCEALVIARGTPPTPGVPTRFVSLQVGPPANRDDDNAPVDYRTLGSLVLVQPGTPLMRRVPAEPGTAGLDVCGQPVAAEPVPDLPFAHGLAGVAVDDDDPCLLRAAVAGAPMLLPQGVQVNSVVEVAAVDLNTGNIDFDGTLRVKGDITSGMTVRVSGDIVVAGTVEAAQVQAGGSLTVSGGIIGMAEAAPGERGQAARTAQVQCAGSVKARFIENAEVSAGQHVAAEREIRNSRIIAGHSVTVGPPGSHQGAVTGGEVCALHSVRAGTLGSMAGVATSVRVGLDPHADARRAALQAERQQLDEEKAKLDKLLEFLRAHPDKAAGGIGERAANTHARLAAGLQDLDRQQAALERQLQPLQSATITAAKRFYGGTTLQIGIKVTHLLEDQVGGKAGLEAGQLVIR
ncbi:FapA family protein [Bordetella petrii]|uniref:FapA family protein n=1 Tax=Bordetella petrii TaxID=94624 RepID=UPI00048F801C|nr:FapA family protein [Bordetella petrii]